MDSPLRLAAVSSPPPASRPPTEGFGQVLARVAGGALRVGAEAVGGLVTGGPVGAAVAGARALAREATSGPDGSGGVGQGDAWDLLEAQKLLAQEGQRFNLAYLQLQDEMQRESRQHTVVSNLLKVRHDSAKAAINNIR